MSRRSWSAGAIASPVTGSHADNEAAGLGPRRSVIVSASVTSSWRPAGRKTVLVAYQACRNVLNMGKHTNKPILEEACRRLVSTDGARRAVSYTAVKNMMPAVRKDTSTRPTGTDLPTDQPTGRPADGAPAPSARDTRGAYLGGAAQFSLENLTKKGSA
ncbi:hypothetical protein ACUY3P_02845 [Corynebacterium lehmanniae]